MSIELDSTLAQAEVLFLSFKQIVHDIDRRQAELLDPTGLSGLRRRRQESTGGDEEEPPRPVNVVGSLKKLPFISDDLRGLLNIERWSIVYDGSDLTDNDCFTM